MPQPGNTDGIELVCFDLGGVLIRICADWADACDKAGINLPPGAVADPAVGAGLARWGDQLEMGVIDLQRFAEEVAQLIGLTPQQVVAVVAAWLRGPYTGVEQLIAAVNAARVQTACLSNTNAYHWQMMTSPGNGNRLPIDSLTYRFASHQVGAMKPSAEIYRRLEQAAAVRPERIMFFDDSPANVAAAAGRRWQAILIDAGADPVAQMTTHLQQHNVLP